MEAITQTIDIVIGSDNLSVTGTNTVLYTILGLILITTTILFILRRSNNTIYKLTSATDSSVFSNPSTISHTHSSNNSSLTTNTNPNSPSISNVNNQGVISRIRSLLSLVILLATLIALTIPTTFTSAAPALTLKSNQDNLQVTVPQGGGTARATTTLTTGTTDSTGYTLTASLTEAEPGVDIRLKGGDIITATTLRPDASSLVIKTTDTSTANDTTDITLDLNIDSTVTPGTKNLKLQYTITDNDDGDGDNDDVLGANTLQDFTASQCNALTTYTGSNEDAIVTLTDTRGDSQQYMVAKLADNNCWMLENLRLGSATSSLELTPEDTNIAVNLTLPIVEIPGIDEYPDEATMNRLYDEPVVIGPVPGDTGVGAANYGYFYNWSAATGGESRASHTETDGSAPYSICPANWRLPSGESIYNRDNDEYASTGDYFDLYRALGGVGNSAWDGESSIAQWQYGGIFKGVLSGYWSVGIFDYLGSGGTLWSASAHHDDPNRAFFAYFGPGGVSPADRGERYVSMAVRCLLN